MTAKHSTGATVTACSQEKKPKEMPAPGWIYYIQTVDLDGALDRAKAKGAKVLNGPMAVPGGARIVQLADPQGAVFALHEEAKAK